MSVNLEIRGLEGLNMKSFYEGILHEDHLYTFQLIHSKRFLFVFIDASYNNDNWKYTKILDCFKNVPGM